MRAKASKKVRSLKLQRIKPLKPVLVILDFLLRSNRKSRLMCECSIMRKNPTQASKKSQRNRQRDRILIDLAWIFPIPSLSLSCYCVLGIFGFCFNEPPYILRPNDSCRSFGRQGILLMKDHPDLLKEPEKNPCT